MGDSEGALVGADEGALLGSMVGAFDGVPVGTFVGAMVGGAGQAWQKGPLGDADRLGLPVLGHEVEVNT